MEKLYLVVAFYFIILILLYFFIIKWKKKKREKFFITIFNAYKEGTLNSNEDLVNIFKGINGDNEEIEVISGINRYLRLFLVELRTNSRYPLNLDVNIPLLVEFITKQIKANEQNQPFADVPALERNYLKDIKKYIELNEANSAIDKLKDLGALILAREDSLERIQKLNKWSIPIAVIGMLLTILFGTIQFYVTNV